MTRLFISYSRVDSDKLQELAGLLKLVYDDIWYDTAGLVGGDVWWEKIKWQIENRDYFLYLLSPESIESEFCCKELDHAIKLNKHIVPIRIRDRTPRPDTLAQIHDIDWFGGKKLEGLARIIASIVRSDPRERERQQMIHQQGERVLRELWDYIDERKHHHFLNFPRRRAINGRDSFFNLEVYLFKRQRAEYAFADNDLEALFGLFDRAVRRFLGTFPDYMLDASPADDFTYFNDEHPEAEQGERHLVMLWNDIRQAHRQIYRAVLAKYPEFFVPT